MSPNLPPPIPSLIPDTAPFSEEQRAWLNGFFAGLVSLDGNGVTALSTDQAAALLAGGATPAAEDDDGGAPWHDQSLPIGERMQLAEGKPLRWKLMAAMAQQDCGQCGYDCRNYSGAIFDGKETRLNLCAPGGKDTARMVKTLAEQIGATPTLDNAPSLAADAVPVAALPPRGTSRDNPATAKVLSRTRLNKPGSEKETWHVEFELEDCLSYEVGDSFGLFPTNDPALVDSIIAALGAPAELPIGQRTLRETLIDSVSLAPAPDMLFQLISYITGGDKRKKARALASGEDPDGDAATLDVLAALEKFPGLRPDPEAFIEALEPLQPRLYSISSSPKTAPGRLTLTVDCVRYKIGKRQRLGVCSTGLAERVQPGETLRAYVQKAHNFALPSDSSRPIIMIGPGTGVAPFRAFLHERRAIKAPGKNWLFFGHQRSASDFFYEDELKAMKNAGHLTRLTLAWSRDSGEKIYVQDRMREVGRDLWGWLTEGASLYVCGDAKRMAKDVERALVDIVAQHGARSAADATAFVSELKKQGRYQQDVY
ncbi:sulfite reductase subunit alpha [Rhodopseudomonas sp. BR0M22]|uniref:sulfite reductase subunit alpha n=1 Tax=Rhodopseudomonas sp. BR0M22 TaxID=2269369 RepID=UPI0013DED767|nr:sulfite reductase subunit alpha [Rhodopseudomonas sp. BR0M22]NEW92946.1 sulfite reductase subunit alpha [Rhodopseudomonas sp. BR0M22]